MPFNGWHAATTANGVPLGRLRADAPAAPLAARRDLDPPERHADPLSVEDMPLLRFLTTLNST